jgi:hypothetical protein
MRKSGGRGGSAQVKSPDGNTYTSKNNTRPASRAAKKLFENRRSRGGQSCPPRVRARILAAGKTARRAMQR